MSETVIAAKGLDGTVVADSKICSIDGAKGILYYYGYSIEDLANNSDFEETTYLLLYGQLPTEQQLAAFRQRMRAFRDIPDPVRGMIRSFPMGAHPMELLQSVISYLSSSVEHKIQHSPFCNCRDTLHQVVQLASVVAAYERTRQGKPYVPARPDLSHGANMLYMMRGHEPDQDEGRIMDRALVLHAEHDFNASTFTARVVASTLSTCYSSISAAIGALYGSLHGGANEKVMDMVEEIGKPEKARDWVNKHLDAKKKVSGMGHRVYKAYDPRAKLMEQDLITLSKKRGDDSYYRILKEVEKAFRERMEEKGKPIYPNVDFFSGAVYKLLGIPTVLFTPVFAVSRVSGWLAHILEQRSDNRIYRPESEYVGPAPQKYVPVENRS